MSKEKPSQSQRREIVLYEEPRTAVVPNKVLAKFGILEEQQAPPFRIVKIVGEKRKRIAIGMAGDSEVG